MLFSPSFVYPLVLGPTEPIEHHDCNFPRKPWFAHEVPYVAGLLQANLESSIV